LNYLVTGCAGFLGFSLSKKLLDGGHLVFGIDSLISGNLKKIEILVNYQNFTFQKGDITNSNFFKVLDFKPDVVINMATVASPMLYQKIPIETLLTCVVGTNNLLEFATRVGSRYIHISTSEIYGDPLVSPIPEDYVGNTNIHGPRACYDVGKQAAETLCVDFHRQHNTSIQIPRIFNTYGVTQSLGDKRVIPTLIKQALTGEPMTVSGDGEQIRSFIHIDDLLSALIKLLNLNNYLGPVNVGNPEPVSINNLVQKIQVISGSKSGIRYTQKPEDDPVIRIPNIDKITAALNWKPNISLDDGLQKVISQYKHQLDHL
jgi:UDP-glucuronate decarboxylase